MPQGPKVAAIIRRYHGCTKTTVEELDQQSSPQDREYNKQMSETKRLATAQRP